MFQLSLTWSWLRLSASFFCLLTYSMLSRHSLSFLTRGFPTYWKFGPIIEKQHKNIWPNISRIFLKESKGGQTLPPFQFLYISFQKKIWRPTFFSLNNIPRYGTVSPQNTSFAQISSKGTPVFRLKRWPGNHKRSFGQHCLPRQAPEILHSQ